MAARTVYRPLTLTERTLLPIGIVVALLGISTAGTWWLAGMCSRLDRIEGMIKDQSKEMLSTRDFELWRLLLKQSNNTLIVPEGPR